MVIEAKRLFYSSAYAQSWRSIRVDTVPCPITVVSGLLAAVLGPDTSQISLATERLRFLKSRDKSGQSEARVAGASSLSLFLSRL